MNDNRDDNLLTIPDDLVPLFQYSELVVGVCGPRRCQSFQR